MNRVVPILVGVFVIVGGIAAYLSMFTVHQTQQALILAFGWLAVTMFRLTGQY